MMLSLKELIVILTIATVVFKFARPIALLFSAEKDFARRRNAWFALTVAAFLLPSFWLFALIAIPVLITTGRKDSNPGALYLLLLQVIPPISVTVPMVGISHLLDIDNYFLLSLFVMVPAAFRLRDSKKRVGIRGLETMDVLILSYGILTAFLFLHSEISRGVISPPTFTDALRRAFVFLIGIYTPYFVISRSVCSRRVIIEDVATLCLSCVLMAALALFESARHWLLYGELAGRWGYASAVSPYYLRAETVRAMVSVGHPLALGFLLEIGFGFWLYLQSFSMSTRYRIAIPLLLWLGLIATYSRGPWIGGACIFFIFYAVRPRAFPALLKAAGISLIVAIAILFSPFGDKIVGMLPFFGGKVDNGSVIYRHVLLDRAWQTIQGSPLLGDQYALLKMQDLRQGEGIIDVVNTYVEVLLGNGFVGLSLFLGFILIALIKTFTTSRRIVATDRDFGMLGASLVACILGTLIMMMDGSFGSSLERVFYLLAGLAAGYSYLGRSANTGQPEILSSERARKVA